MATEETDTPVFKSATVHEIFRHTLDPNTRVSSPALHLSAEYLRLFATEAMHRAAEVARKEMGEKEVGGAGSDATPSLLGVKHLERVLPGLLLDF